MTTRAPLDSPGQIDDEWVELSTRLRERPPASATLAAATPTVRSDVVLRIRIPKLVWWANRGTPRPARSSHRGVGDRLYSLLYQ